MKTQKMVKTAKALDKVFKILQRVVILCAIAAVIILSIFTAANVAAPDFIAGADSVNVSVGPLTLRLAEGAMPGTILGYTWILVVGAIVYIAVMCYVLGVLRKMLRPMAEGNPFAPSVSREIRKLAFAGLAIGMIANVMSFVETFAAVRIFDLSSLLQNTRLRDVSVNFHFDITSVILFFVLLLLSYIFQYGEELQKLSDETL